MALIRFLALSSLMTVWAISLTTADETPAKGALPRATVTTPDWLKYAAKALTPGQIDALVDGALKKAGSAAMPITTDEQFLRRVYVDLTGKLPTPAQLTAFSVDADADKRTKVIDKLLASDDFAKHWAGYFTEVLTSKISEPKGLRASPGFAGWLAEQLKANKSWGQITKSILTASGSIQYEDDETNGQLFFLTSRFGDDAPTELAGETARVFLGIQIQCAQCHDHPSDIWKREQFHEFASYFARMKGKQVKGDGVLPAGVELVSLPASEYFIPKMGEPPVKAKKMVAKGATPLEPRFFIDGKTPGRNLSDAARRAALADAVTSKNNPWFAAAFVNRIWGELMGQAFYMPIDDLGPSKEAVMPEVIGQVSASFRASNYDVRKLFHDIMTARAYQRRIRPGDSDEDNLLFAGRTASRMEAAALWQSLTEVLGPLTPKDNFAAKGKALPKMAAKAGAKGLEGQFMQEFQFDPSTRPEDVEGSVSQALLLMNNPAINNRIQAQVRTLMATVLTPDVTDDVALPYIYMRTLARRPTTREAARCKQYIREAPTRTAAYEDIMWALINSTEFQTNR